MKVFYLIVSHILAFGLGWHCCFKLFQYINTKVDFDEAAERLIKRLIGDDE